MNGSDTNPYESPPPHRLADQPDPRQPGIWQRGSKRGPALYIVVIGMLFGVLGSHLLASFNSLGLAMPLLGCMLGGLIYRLRSANWPIDPTARKRQLAYAVSVQILVPAALLLVADPSSQVGVRVIIIGAIVGFSVAIGALVSGVRRDGSYVPFDDSSGHPHPYLKA